MENIILTLHPFHLPALCEAVRARAVVVKTDTTSTETDKAICADLEMRVNLLAAAVDAETMAKANRKAYNSYVWGAPQPTSRRSRARAAKQAREQQEQGKATTTTTNNMEPSQTEGEAATSSADVVKRPL